MDACPTRRAFPPELLVHPDNMDYDEDYEEEEFRADDPIPFTFDRDASVYPTGPSLDDIMQAASDAYVDHAEEDFVAALSSARTTSKDPIGDALAEALGATRPLNVSSFDADQGAFHFSNLLINTPTMTPAFDPYAPPTLFSVEETVELCRKLSVQEARQLISNNRAAMTRAHHAHKPQHTISKRTASRSVATQKTVYSKRTTAVPAVPDTIEPIPPVKKRTKNTWYTKDGKLRFWTGVKLFCEHEKPTTACIQCGGGSLCEHGVIKYACRPCGGRSFCKHNVVKYGCKACKTAKIAAAAAVNSQQQIA